MTEPLEGAERARPREVATLAELDALDIDRVVSGYRAGFARDPDYSARDKAYWHGYLNALVDTGQAKISPTQVELARLAAARSALR